MRPARPLSLLIALSTLLLPTAAAAEPELRITAPEGTLSVAADEVVSMPLTVRAAMRDVWCPRDTTFLIQLRLEGGEGASAQLDRADIPFTVPAGQHALASFDGENVANLTLRGLAEGASVLEVHAAMEGTRSCVSFGGIPGTHAALRVDVRVSPPNRPPTPTPEPTPEPTPGPTPEPTPEPTPDPTSGPVLPRPGEGFIGDYRPPGVPVAKTPGLGVPLLAVALAATALVVGRSRRKV